MGNVVHVDYANERVDVLSPQAAEAVFRDPRTYVLPANFDEGIPLVHAAFGAASGDRFALDTGSPHLFALAPFEHRNAGEIAAHWEPATFRAGRTRTEERYLEGSIVVVPRRVASFTLGPQRFENLVVGVEESNSRRDAIDIPLDGDRRNRPDERFRVVVRLRRRPDRRCGGTARANPEGRGGRV